MLLVTGCQTAPVNLNLLHANNTPIGTKISQQCHIKILPVNDVRSNKETLGSAGGVPVLSNNVTGWVKQGMNSGLQQRGYQVSERTGDLSMQVNVKLAYMRPLPLRLYATVSLEVILHQKEKQLYQNIFRANGDSNNWANGEGEIMDVLNVALNNVVDDVATDIQPACSR